jgi:glucuronate isomerase
MVATRMTFITEKFLLHTETAQRLYHAYAAQQPVFDYHCHLPPKDIAENRRFKNLFEIWLEGDHYKWRAMRANGVDEKFCTGDASPYDKFLAWAKTVPDTLRNPLYHWTHLELKRYFGIDQLLNAESADEIWHEANEKLHSGDLDAHGIIRKFGVKTICTTDDPTDSLEHHVRLQAAGVGFQVFPAFRPDQALNIQDAAEFNAWINKLGTCTDIEIRNLAELLSGLEKRHGFFHQHGCRLSDHGLDYCYADPCSDREAEGIFNKVRNGTNATSEEFVKFAGFLMLFFGRLDAAKGWTKQLHLGAYRSASTRARRTLGRDTGFDSIGDWPQAAPLLRYLDQLDQDNQLPKIVVYNLNPADDYIFASLIGNFQDGSVAGKVQFGSAWWFLDQKEGIELQLNALSNCGLLARFVGMVTDSRSFMSYPRHEYFRRVLCNLLGMEMELGELPNDEELVGNMIRNICFQNASNYFALPPGKG